MGLERLWELLYNIHSTISINMKRSSVTKIALQTLKGLPLNVRGVSRLNIRILPTAAGILLCWAPRQRRRRLVLLAVAVPEQTSWHLDVRHRPTIIANPNSLPPAYTCIFQLPIVTLSFTCYMIDNNSLNSLLDPSRNLQSNKLS